MTKQRDLNSLNRVFDGWRKALGSKTLKEVTKENLKVYHHFEEKSIWIIWTMECLV